MHEIQNIPSTGLGAGYTLYTRFRIAQYVAQEIGVRLDARAAGVIIAPPLTTGAPFTLSASTIVAWTGRSAGTLWNKKRLMQRVQERYQVLKGRDNLDDDEGHLLCQLEDLHSPPSIIAGTPVARRPAAWSWSFRDLERLV